MSIRFIQAVASLLSVTILMAAQAGQSGERSDGPREFAKRAGTVLGAAALCNGVGPARARDMIAKVKEILRASAQSEADTVTFNELFAEAQFEGASLAAARQYDCAVAGREVVDLEKALSSGTSRAAIQSVLPSSPEAPVPVHGLTANEIRFGASLALTGPNRDVGQQINIGIETAFKEANNAGGVHGRFLRFIMADDGYEPARTSEAMRQLYDDDQVFGFIGNLGSPNAAVYVPFAIEHRMIVFAPFSGSSVVRHVPPDRYVFNYRPSYAEEVEAHVRYLVKLRHVKPEQIAVFAQTDALGDAGVQAVAKVMRELRGGDGGGTLRLSVARNSLDVAAAVAQLRASRTPIKAIVMMATPRPATRFIEKSRDAYPGLIYTSTSIAGNLLRDELMLLGPKYAAGVIVTQAVPPVDSNSSLVLEYRTALSKYFRGETPDVTSLEYYIVGKIMVEALKRAGPRLDTEKLVDVFEAMRDFDTGLGAPITFGMSEHQGSHHIWGTEISESGKYEPIELQ